jgi:anti-anti-sigma factor
MTLDQNQDTGVLTISGTLDIDAANSLRESLLDGLRRRPEITADLTQVDSCDAAAVQVLLAAGKTLRIVAASDAVRETAAALGVRLAKDQSDAS